MHKFMTFVNGSNLFGTFKHLEVFVDDYEALFRFIFEQSVNRWRTTFVAPQPPPAQQVRVCWYVVDSMDEWDLTSMRSRQYLMERFMDDREIRSRWMADTNRQLAGTGTDMARIEQTAFNACFEDFKGWYEKKQSILGGMNRFYHAVEASSDFLEMRRCGRWKVDLLHKTITEKGLDVGFAVDMVAYQQSYDVALLIAADIEGIPSLDYIKDAGKQVVAVDFIKGSPNDWRNKPITSKYKLAADCVVPIYESDLLKSGLATKGEGSEFAMRDSEA